jgi:hypothetical protein
MVSSGAYNRTHFLFIATDSNAAQHMPAGARVSVRDLRVQVK